MTSVVVTRPRHPLEGRTLRVLGQLRRHGRLELLLVLPDGSKSLVPAAWTDLDAGSPACGGAGQATAATLGSVADLLHACGVVSALLIRGEGEGEQAARQSPCKEDNRAACAAQSDAGSAPGATPGPDGPASRAAGGSGDVAAGLPDRQGSRRNGSCGGDRGLR